MLLLVSCEEANHEGCDRSLNQICALKSGKLCCICPEQFEQHPITHVCGGDLCNPQIVSSCPSPEICQLTPHGNYRCTCPSNFERNIKSGLCVSKYSSSPSMPSTIPSVDACTDSKQCQQNEYCAMSYLGKRICQCLPGYKVDSSGRCQSIETCEPYLSNSCDERRREECLPDGHGHFTCQCAANYHRHPITHICLIDECATGKHDCDEHAKCVDTDDGYICTCLEGYIDESPNQSKKPGRICRQQIDECAKGIHNCSANAICIDLPNGFLCRCKENYIDFSPNPQYFGGTICKPFVDECADKSLNTCSENAVCIDTKESYKCQCKQGFIDHDELRNPGRICEKANRLCSTGQNDCDKNAKCIEKGTNEYICVCDPGFIDKSPEPAKSGRICVEYICNDPRKHDCHQAATCTEVAGSERYTCSCRNGYIDMNPSKPGRDCKELVNECLDQSLNDCDQISTCHDLTHGYTCTCPSNSKDISPDPQSKPGRICSISVNECSNPNLHNCSRFADCIDQEDGYICRCKPGYHDNNPYKPGTDCTFILNECESQTLNNCDRNAKCIDTNNGFRCECIAPYIDKNPSQPGTICRYNECENPATNDCDENAICIDTDDGYSCQCKPGFYDGDKDSVKAGRICIALRTQQPHHAETTPVPPNLRPCGTNYCNKDLGEVCIGGETCGCRPEQARSSSTEKCINAIRVPIEIRIVKEDENRLLYSSEYSKPESQRYVEIVDKFVKDIGTTIKKTSVGPQYIITDVNYITNPKVKNSTWDNGLLINATADFTSSVDQCQFWQEFLDKLKSDNYRLGNGKLLTASDLDLLNPCRKEEHRGFACGKMFCQETLGEICIAGRLCGCPFGEKRTGQGEKCRAVESWSLPLWVVREGNKEINYDQNLANPHDEHYKKLVSGFEKGIAESYANTPLRNAFVNAEVNDIMRPSDFMKGWDKGILYNFTANFVRGTVASPVKVGKSKQFINSMQANPFDSCFRSDCHPDAICTPTSSGYECKCRDTHRDLNPSNPGRNCLNVTGVNECERNEWNECDEHARCIDEHYLYRCECVKPYIDAAPPDKLPGSVCRLDYCSDTHFCSANTTCVSQEEGATCVCKPGYTAVSTDENIQSKIKCLLPEDVDECALGLHNCSAVAICTDLPNGYECRCPEGYVDGNPKLPGRICAAQLCGLCNDHGDCLYNQSTQNVTCVCHDGYTGEFCEIPPSKTLLILFLILAALLLLLSLCCCMYFCSKLRCFRRRSPETSIGSGQEILGSDYYSIPRAKLKRRDIDEMTPGSGHGDAGQLQRYLDEGRSISGDSTGSSSVEFERRVITDITTHEIKTTTYHDPVTGKAIYEVTATSSSNVDGGDAQYIQTPIQIEDEQHAGEESYARSDSAMEHLYSRSRTVLPAIEASEQSITRDGVENYSENEAYRQEEDIGDATFDRSTKLSTRRDFLPAEYGRGGTERRRNEFTTTTRSRETNYY
ncbi:unnamed protein product [Thelazia callipaeda]|uniref:EGF-like domain-containing protein n=1 Tax=Thelazia callipaeda TaxID=103827 RepID=A0A0N5DAV2_THECL|nr:unnamed protein product [Thelazia callipaeda]